MSNQRLSQVFPNYGLRLLQSCEDLLSVGGSVDIITVEQTLYQFSLERFNPEVKRVFVSRMLFVDWGYELVQINSEADKVTTDFTNTPSIPNASRTLLNLG